jgi:hypothetical protein
MLDLGELKRQSFVAWQRIHCGQFCWKEIEKYGLPDHLIWAAHAVVYEVLRGLLIDVW